jgi:hypothetical protein
MSKQAAEHHKQAAEHLEQAAKQHLCCRSSKMTSVAHRK